MEGRVLDLMHTPVTSGHPSEQKMYVNLIYRYYWPRTTLYLILFVRVCQTCTRDSIHLRRYANIFTLLTLSASLEYIEIYLMDSLLKSEGSHFLILLISDIFRKLTKAAPLLSNQIKAFYVAQDFSVHWFFASGSSKLLLLDKDPPFSLNLMQIVCKNWI